MSELVKLASASPERRSILEELGFSVEVTPLDIDETPIEGESASALVERLAKKKLQASKPEQKWTVAADTVVGLSGKILGKPKDEADARSTLSSLIGKKISVWTATSMVSPNGKYFHDLSVARLEGKNWSMKDIEAYLKNGLWKGRAGSFSVFHEPTPVILVEGRLDVVRGLNGQAVSNAIRGQE